MKDFFPKVSVIVPIKENKKEAIDSIESILNQTYKNIEILLVGEKDALDTLRNRYQDKLNYQYINSFDIVNALNEGLKKIKGEFVSLLFYSDIFKNDKIEKELIAFSKIKDSVDAICSCKIDHLNDLTLLTNTINESSFLYRKDSLKSFKECKTTFIEQKILELKNIELLKENLVEESNEHIKDEKELIDLWKLVINKHNEKDLIDEYKTLHEFYVKGINAFNKYNLIYPKEIHDMFISNKFNPLISVVIPVYNGSNYIKEAIESVLKQTYTNYELIVVEDGSTDGGLTKDCVMEFKDKLNYYHKENGGVGSALNLGIEKAKGKYISWLSHDDAYYPFKLQMQVDALNELKEKDTIVFSNFQLMDENSNVFVSTEFDTRFGIENLENKIFPVLNGTTNGCAMLIPKEAFNKCGGFDVSQRTTNDYIMWFNIFSEFPSKFLKEHLIKYRIHKKQDSQASPIYIPESEEMWTNTFKKITKKEIESYGYSELEFYSKFYHVMSLGGLVKTSEYLKERYEETYKKEGPLVSVIMPCYNSEKYLRVAVDSILNQSFKAFELICVDDSSTDSTYSILKEYENSDFRVKAVKNKHKKGVSGAMNTGLELARGEYITRMDSDDISYSERLLTQFDFLKNNKDYGIVSVNIDLREDNNIVGKGSYKNSLCPIEWKFLWENPYPNAPSMFRKSILKDTRFNEDLSIAEDYQFFMKLAKNKIYYIDQVLYSYRISKSSLYHNNRLKSIYNSLEVASSYYYDITNKELPNIYYYLSDFSGDETPSVEINNNEILKFLEETLDSFKKHFKWNDEEYKEAFNYTMSNVYARLISKIARKNSYETKEYQKIIGSFSWKITKPIRFGNRVVKKGTSLAKRAIKKVIK